MDSSDLRSLLFITNKIMNNIGSASVAGDVFSRKINQVFICLISPF